MNSLVGCLDLCDFIVNSLVLVDRLLTILSHCHNSIYDK